MDETMISRRWKSDRKKALWWKIDRVVTLLVLVLLAITFILILWL